MVLIPPYSVCPLCAHFSASSLHCIRLCLRTGTRTRKSAALPLHGPLLQPHLVLSHSMLITNDSWLLPAIPVCHYQEPLAPQPVSGAYTLAPYLLGFRSRVHGSTSAPAFTNKAENLLPCHEKVIPDTFSPTVQVLLPQTGLSIERFVELCFRKVILIWYFVVWERLDGSRVSPVSYAISCCRGKDAGT